MRTCLASVVLVLASVGCTSSSSSSSSTGGPCDPLTPDATSLSNVVGVGTDANGTTYVVDEPKKDYGYRLFVTRDGTLVREHAAGTGSSGSSNLIEFTDPGADDSTARTIFFDVAGGKATSMQLGEDDTSSGEKGGTPDETLTLVDASTIANLPVENLPRKVWLVSDISDGSVLFLTLAGDDDDGSDAARLFYGSPNDQAQATIDQLSQSKTGDVYVTFHLPSGSYDAHLANGVPASLSGSTLPAADTIITPSGTLTTTERTDATVTGSFVCN
ncbi:MAG TPA: hypothetical protein VF407_06950 [Polyangiaceae bacterium]